MSKYADKSEELLERAADALQDYCAEVSGDMNNAIAMEIYTYLTAYRSDLQEALCIIVNEYPKNDDRHIVAVEMADRHGIDLGEGV